MCVIFSLISIFCVDLTYFIVYEIFLISFFYQKRKKRQYIAKTARHQDVKERNFLYSVICFIITIPGIIFLLSISFLVSLFHFIFFLILLSSPFCFFILFLHLFTKSVQISNSYFMYILFIIILLISYNIFFTINLELKPSY